MLPPEIPDEPEWKGKPIDLLACMKCRSEHNIGRLEHYPLTFQAPNSESRGYCERHGEHNKFETISPTEWLSNHDD